MNPSRARIACNSWNKLAVEVSDRTRKPPPQQRSKEPGSKEQQLVRVRNFGPQRKTNTPQDHLDLERGSKGNQNTTEIASNTRMSSCLPLVRGSKNPAKTHNFFQQKNSSSDASGTRGGHNSAQTWSSELFHSAFDITLSLVSVDY